MKKYVLIVCVFLLSNVLLAQTNISGIINTYAAVVNIPVCNPCASTCNYVDVASTTGFSVGAKVLIIQMQGATTDLSNTATFGSITSYGNAGYYEFQTISSLTATRLTFSSTLYNTYDVAGAVQVITVPQYTSATVTAKLTAMPWNGSTGGILAFDVSGTLTLNANVDVNATGFRGGLSASNGTTYPYDQTDYFYPGAIYEKAAPKGEGIAQMIAGYELGRGSYANAGGGGNAHNGGGGGGANGGAGGFGGNQYNTPGLSLSRGIGGNALVYSSGDRVFMGGGGGGGHQNDTYGTKGGNGGGIVFINANQIVGNNFKITASGDSSRSTTPPGNDGAGGAGGGGAIKINVNSYSNVSLLATGGKGGDNVYTGTDEHAPGGGGGGGVVCLPSASLPVGVAIDVSGGVHGVYRLNGDNFGTTSGANGQILTSCTSTTPSGPKQLKPDLGSAIQLCDPITATLDARMSGNWYTYAWFKNDVLIPGATSSTYTTNETGLFKVEVTSTGCLPGADSVQITTNTATAVNATFCAPPAQIVHLAVTGAGKYKWWDAATLGNTVAKGLSYSPTLSATTTYYVEDTSTISGSVGPTVLNTTGLVGNSNNSQLGFSLSQDIQITSLRVPFVSYYSPPAGFPAFTVTVEVVDQNGNSFTPAQVFTSNLSLETVPPNDANNSRLYTFPFTNFTIPASLGANLRLKIAGNTHPNGAPLFNQGATMAYPYTSSIPGVVTINGSYTNNAAISTSDYASFYDWQFTTRATQCKRVPVIATLSCPATCVKPNSVSVQLGTGVNDTLCVGNALLIQKNLIDTTSVTSTAGFYFSWRRINSTGSTLVAGPSKVYANFSKAAVAVTDSGRYYLIVQDGPGSVASTCKDSAMVHIVINKAPSAKGLIASNQEMCKGATAAAFTEVKPATGTVGSPLLYNWYSASDSVSATPLKITGATSNVYTPAAGTPLVTTYYVRKDSVAYCAAVKTNFVKVRVNNKAILNKIIPVLRDTLCAGEQFNLSTSIALADSTGANASVNGGYYFTWKKYQGGILQTTKGPAPYKNYLAANAVVALADSGLYWLIAQDGIGATTCKDSIMLRIVVNQSPTVKAIIGSNQELCKGAAAATITELAPPQNYYGTPLNYKWYTTADTTGTPTLALISGSTASSYNPGSPLLTQYYVRKDSVKYCSAVATDYVKIRVNNSVILDSIEPIVNDTLCTNLGDKFQIKGYVDSITAGKASINGGYYFTWMQLQQPATVPVVVGTPGVYADYPTASRTVVETDSGTYYLIVQDGAGATKCKDTLKIKIVVYNNCVSITPSCVKPNLVTTQLLAGVNDTLCEGNSLTIQKNIIDTSGGPSLYGYYFSWRKINNAGSILLAPPSKNYNDIVIPSVTEADSGRYYLIVQDGLTGDVSCKDSSAAISIVVNKPIATPAVIASSDTICAGSTPSQLVESTASTGSTGMPYRYQWYSSADSFKTAAGISIITGEHSKDYQPPALNATEYFMRIDSAGVCSSVKTNIITIVVDTEITQAKIGGDTAICAGNPVFPFKELLANTGGSGVYTYQWQSSPDDHTFTDIPGATTKVYQSPNIFSRTYFRRIDSGGACASVSTDTIVVDAITGVNPGQTSGPLASICYNTIPPTGILSLSGATGGSGGPGSEHYQWQQSTDQVVWVDIAGANGLNYTETNQLTDTTYYRRQAGMGPGYCDTAYTVPVAINVYPILLPGAIAADTTICSGTSITVKKIAAATGGGNPGTQTYQWIASTDNGVTWSNAAGTSNQPAYTTPVLTDTVIYKRIVLATCGQDTSNAMTVSVDSISHVSISMADAETCIGVDVTFTATPAGQGTAATTYVWQTATSIGGPWTTISGAGAASYTVTAPQLADSGTVYKVILTSAYLCASGTAQATGVLKVHNTVVPKVTATSSPAGAMCDFVQTITYTATPVQGQGTAPTYQWYDGKTNTLIPGATNVTYTPAAKPANGDKVYVMMQTNLACATTNAPASNVVVLDVRVAPHPVVVTKDTVICSPNEVNLYTGNTAASGTTFQWYKNNIAIPGATSSTYTVTSLEIPGGDYTFLEDNGVCNLTTTAVHVTILESPSVDAGQDIYAVEGETITLSGTVSNATSYAWVPAGGLSNPYSLNPNFVASASTIYLLQAFNNNSKCVAGDAVQIFVEPLIKIPNVITVNGDGVNDTWKIEYIENYPNATFEIFNRWGNLVWKSTGYPKQWDGTNFRNGEVLPEGTYFYIIDLHSVKVKNAFSGYVQLMK